MPTWRPVPALLLLGMSLAVNGYRQPAAIKGSDRDEPVDQGVLGLRLTVLLSSGVSAAGGGSGPRRRGRVDAVRAEAGAEPDAAAGGGIPPAGVDPVGVPAGGAD